MRILFLTHNFHPEVNAPASRTLEHCRRWKEKGAEVTVITCAPNFPDGKVYRGYKNKIWQKENIDGINVIRIWAYIVPNKGILKRTLGFISYSVSSFLAGLFCKTDIIVATSPQFFTALSGKVLSFWKRKPWIMEVRDLWPESIKSVGVSKYNSIIKYFERKELQCYNSAKHIVVVTDTFKKILIERGIKPEKISVHKNGVNNLLFNPSDRKDSNIIKQLRLEGKIIIGYVGTHGLAHKLDFILDCASKLQNLDNSYHFLFIGNGARKEDLLKQKESLSLRNVTMLDTVSKSKVRDYLSIIDICLINLKKSELFKTVLPSKIFENAAMEIPILMGVEGEAKALIEKYNAGICFEPENEDDFMNKLQTLKEAENRDKYKEGCRQLAKDFDRNVIADQMYELIQNVAK